MQEQMKANNMNLTLLGKEIFIRMFGRGRINLP